MVVHGIPGSYELQRGDILSIDIGVILDGWVADAAITHPIGNVTPIARACWPPPARRCSTRSSRPGRATGSATSPHAVQARVEGDGFAVIRSLVGHGIGREMHEDPQIPNFGDPGTGPELEEGMVLAIEPMVNVGTHHVRMGQDNWAVYSQDGSLAAHFEHTVAVTADGPRILTPWHELVGDGRRSGRGFSLIVACYSCRSAWSRFLGSALVLVSIRSRTEL